MKRNLHAKYGVREYRIVDPEGKRVELLSWTEGGYRTEAVYPHTDRLFSRLGTVQGLQMKPVTAK